MATIKNRRGTAAQWASANPILAAGEMGVELDTNKQKMGDGATPYNALEYMHPVEDLVAVYTAAKA